MRFDLETDEEIKEAIVIYNTGRKHRRKGVGAREKNILKTMADIRAAAHIRKIEGNRKGGMKGGGDRKSKNYKEAKEKIESEAATGTDASKSIDDKKKQPQEYSNGHATKKNTDEQQQDSINPRVWQTLPQAWVVEKNRKAQETWATKKAQAKRTTKKEKKARQTKKI